MKASIRKLLDAHVGQEISVLLSGRDGVYGILRKVDDDFVHIDVGTRHTQQVTVDADLAIGISRQMSHQEIVARDGP